MERHYFHQGSGTEACLRSSKTLRKGNSHQASGICRRGHPSKLFGGPANVLLRTRRKPRHFHGHDNVSRNSWFRTQDVGRTDNLAFADWDVLNVVILALHGAAIDPSLSNVVLQPM